MIPYPSHGRRLLDGLAAVLLGGLGAAGLLGSMGSIEARAQGPDESAETGVAAVDPAWLSLIESERRLDALAGLDGLAAGGLSLHALLEDAAVSGFAPAGLPVSVAFQRGQSANSIVNLTPQFTEFGWLFTGSFTEVRFSTPGGFLPGDLLTVTQGAQSLTLTVQALTARTHTLTDTVTGSAVPNAALTAFLYPALEPGQVFTATAVAGSGGAYQAPIAEGISAGDRGLVRQALDADRSLSTRLIAPQIMVQVGGESVSGITGPNSRVTIRAFSGGTPKFETSIVTSGQDGFFGHCFGTCDGHLGDPRLLPGDLVEIDTLGQIITTTVPQLTATPDRMAGEVTGISNPATQVSVRRWPGPVRPYGAAWSISFDTTNAATTGVDGRYTVRVPLQPKDYGVAMARDSEGHLGYVPFTLPYLRLQLGDVGYLEPILDGQISQGLVPFTLTIQGPSGYLKSQSLLRSNWLGAFDLYSGFLAEATPELGLGSGDVITVETAVGIEAVVAVPELTIRADAEAQRITGRAPAGTSLVLHLDGVEPATQYPYGYDTQVVVGADGAYTLDLNDVSLSEASAGLVRLTTEAGHDIQRFFRTDQVCLPGVWSVVVGGNRVHYRLKYLSVAGCDRQFTVSLLDDHGIEKGRAVQQYIDYFYDESTAFVDGDGVPIRILPGDRLRLSTGDQSREFTVPTLTIAVDEARTRVSGQAPPGAEVAVEVDNLLDQLYAPRKALTTTVGVDGVFELPMALRAGDRVEATFIGARSTRFTAYAAVPGVMLTLFQNHLAALLPPLEPFAFTLQSPRAIQQNTFSGRANDQGLAQNGPSPIFGAPWGDIRPGDRLTIQAGAVSRQIEAPIFTAYLDPTARQITGTAPADRPVWIELNGPGSTVSTTSTITGAFVLTLPPGASLDGMFSVKTALPGGDIVVREVAALRWAVSLGADCLDIRFPGAIDRAQLEVRSPAGAVKTALTLDNSGYTMGSWSGCLSPDPARERIAAGDRLMLATAQGDWAFTVPELTASHDPQRDVVVGRGPVGATLLFTPQFIIMPWQLPRGRMVPVDDAGGYGFDISDVVWRSGQIGTVVYSDSIGNVVMRSFYLIGFQQWLPFVGHP